MDAQTAVRGVLRHRPPHCVLCGDKVDARLWTRGCRVRAKRAGSGSERHKGPVMTAGVISGGGRQAVMGISYSTQHTRRPGN